MNSPSIRRRLFYLIAGILCVFAVFGMYAYTYLSNSRNDWNLLVNSVKDIERKSYLNSLAQDIRYYDETLTQSARNYVFIGGEAWKERYRDHSTKLDAKIKEAIDLGDQEDRKTFENIGGANAALVDMEERAIDLMDAGDRTGAIAILSGRNYISQKEVYDMGLKKYYGKRGKDYSDALSVYSGVATSGVETFDKNLFGSGLIMFIFVGLAFLAGIIVYWQIKRIILDRIDALSFAMDEVADGNLNERVVIENEDEIGKLGKSFNKTVGEIQELRTSLDNKVKDRTESLEKLNSFMVGRELKMIELKERIKELENRFK